MLVLSHYMHVRITDLVVVILCNREKYRNHLLLGGENQTLLKNESKITLHVDDLEST